MRRASEVAAAASLVLAAGCGEDEQPDARTKYFDVYLDDEVRVCGRQLEDYDRFTERVFDFWTGNEPQDFRADVEVAYEPCLSVTGQGCVHSYADADGGYALLTSQSAQYHELTHVMHIAVDGTSAPSLNEGLAEALGHGFPVTGAPWVRSEGTPPDILFAEGKEDVDYGSAAMFARFLIDGYGVQAFRAYFRAMLDRERRAPDDFRREFAGAFGEPLDAAWDVYLSQPEERCTYDFWFCDERRPIALPFETAIACDDPDALGFEAPSYTGVSDGLVFPYSPTRIVHLDLDEPRLIRFQLDNVAVYLGRCGGCPEQQPLRNELGDPVSDLWQDIDLQLPAGTWALVVYARPEDGSPRFAMTALD